MTDEAMGMVWGDKGCVRDLDHPEHRAHHPKDGCLWCCMRCNTDTHRCPGCGTVADHKNTACPQCVVEHKLAPASNRPFVKGHDWRCEGDGLSAPLYAFCSCWLRAEACACVGIEHYPPCRLRNAEPPL